MGGGAEPENMAEPSHGPGQDRSAIKLSFPSTLEEGERGEREEGGESQLQKKKERVFLAFSSITNKNWTD